MLKDPLKCTYIHISICIVLKINEQERFVYERRERIFFFGKFGNLFVARNRLKFEVLEASRLGAR